MKSTAYKEKKKNAIPPPRMATHAAICLILDITVNSKNTLLNLLNHKVQFTLTDFAYD